VHVLPRLYAILDLDGLERRRLDAHAVLEAWLDAGVRLVQLRAKTQPSGVVLVIATDLAAQCHQAGATFIVNDRADIAALAGADGVHLGQEDLSPSAVRRILPPPAIVGFSTHSEAQAENACRQPISYLAIGPVFATTSKARPDPVVGLAGVREAARIASAHGLPVVAIGGITLDRAPAVIAAGASSVAVISDLLEGDLRDRARAFLRAVA
jgi:thiamine-phosphate pyrophosphorylase